MGFSRSLAFAALTLLAALSLGSTAATASVGVDLRVLRTDGRALSQLRQFTDTATIKTDPNADCFGPNTGGSGKSVEINGPTALGLVQHATVTQRALRPLSVTDAFGFGLGLCGFGGFEADQDHFWYLKKNHVEQSVGGDQVALVGGDDVIWYLMPISNCPPPDFFCQVSDLLLKMPLRARPGQVLTATVLGYDHRGKVGPAAGATVFGGAAPAVTGPDGRATVVVPTAGIRRVYAKRGGDIPSQAVRLCVAESPGKTCPRKQGKTIAGSGFADRIVGTPGRDKVKALGGNDRISVRGGNRDKVKCGAGRDSVKADRRDRVAGSCEKVRRG